MLLLKIPTILKGEKKKQKTPHTLLELGSWRSG